MVKVKKAISAWSFAEKDVFHAMDLAAQAGFQGIELAMDCEGAIALNSTAEQLERVKRYAAEKNLTIHGLACSLCWENSFAADDSDERERAYQVAVRQIELARSLGAETVLLVPGSVQTALRPGKEIVSYDIAYQRNMKMFQRLKRTAEANKIIIGIENVWNKIFLSPLEFRTFLDEINSDYVGAYLDVGNVLATGYPEQWIRILGSRIKKVHFKDFRCNVAGFDGFVDLLEGDVNWPEVMAAFAEINYSGWATAEMIPPYTHCPDQILFNTSASMDRIFEMSGNRKE